jgi:hypothetical protein
LGPLFLLFCGEEFFLLLLCWIFRAIFLFVLNGLWAIMLLSNNSKKTAAEQRGTAARLAALAPSFGSIKCGHVKERDGIDAAFCPASPFHNLRNG